MASLEISLWPQEIQSPMQFCLISNFENQIQFSHKSCHWIILQPSHTLETLDSILHRNPFNSSPDTPDTQSLANSFLQFFSDKIERIHSKFSPSDSLDPSLFPIISSPNLSNFNPTTFSEIRNLIFSSQNKQCELDSIPTFLWNSVLTNLAQLCLIS